jgi:beta-glucosidase
VERAPDAELWLGMHCGTGCSGRVPLKAELAAAPQDAWLRLGVPLKCLRAAGADMRRIDVPLRLETEGRATLALSSVALGTDVDRVLACDRP